MAHFSSDICRTAQRQVCLPLLPVPVFVLIGLAVGLLVSTHESLAIIARDYVCCIMCALVSGLYYNYRLLRIIYETCEELVAYRNQMDHILEYESKVRKRGSSMELHRKRLAEKN